METSWIKNLIGNLKIKFNFDKSHSKNLKIVDKSKGKQILNHGLTNQEVIHLVDTIVSNRLSSFENQARYTYELRTNAFKEKLLEDLKSATPEELNRLQEPDTQIAMIEATNISGRRGEKTLSNMLSSLVVEKITKKIDEKTSLKDIVYNEAIKTIGKLTEDQLKIITLCFILRHTRNEVIFSTKLLDQYITKSLQPFFDFKNTISQFEHIQYSGCGSLSSVGSWSFYNIWRENYFFIFDKEVQPDQIEDLKLNGLEIAKIFTKKPEEKTYRIPYHKNAFPKFLEKEGITDPKKSKIIQLRNRLCLNDNEIKEFLGSKTSLGEELVKTWDNSRIKNLSLTSVGKLIAITYYKQITGSPLNVDIWIN